MSEMTKYKQKKTLSVKIVRLLKANKGGFIYGLRAGWYSTIMEN